MRAGPLLLVTLLGLPNGIAARADERDIPSRVGRIDLVSGAVSFRLLRDKGWWQANFNYPVYTGMSLSTEDKARAEISIGANSLQMSSDTLLDITILSDRLTDIALHQGRVHLSLQVLRPGEGVELELAKGSVWVLQAGYYEIDLSAGDVPSQISVINGKARFIAVDADLDITTDQKALLHDDTKVTLVPEKPAATSAPAAQPADTTPAAGAPAPQATPKATANPSDDFLVWATGRDSLPISDAPKNLTRDTSGFVDLGAYGAWQDSDAYGRVWSPTGLPADWQPYRFGHWISVPPWGPTWVDDQPWGFVPFHYGRWTQIDGRWCWVPGDPDQPAVYAPALVAFLGALDDAGIMDDSGDPAVAWVPLAPDEPFAPWYSADPVYIEQVNAANVRDFHRPSVERLAELRRDEHVDGFANNRFATAISRAAFVAARPVAAAMVHIATESLSRAPMMADAPRVGIGEGRHLAPEPAVFHPPSNAREVPGERPEMAPHPSGGGPPSEHPGASHPELTPHPSGEPPNYHPVGPAPNYRSTAPMPAYDRAPIRQFVQPIRPTFQVPQPSRPNFAPRPAPSGGGRRR